MHCKRITLALLIGGAFAPGVQAGQDYSPEWWLDGLRQACQTAADGVARCLAGAAAPPRAAAGPFSLPALPSPFPGMDPKTNPYLVHTPYAQGAATQQASAMQGRAGGATLAAASAGSAKASALTPAATALTATGSDNALASARAPIILGTLAGLPGMAAPMPPTQGYAPRPGTGGMTPAAASTASLSPLASTQAPAATSARSPDASHANPLTIPPAKSPTSPDDAPSRPIPEPANPAMPARNDNALAHFEFDKAELTDAGRAALDAWWAEHVAGLRARIAGHADRFGPERYNLALSRRRAESVAQYLTGKGMKAEELVIIAKGESEPRVACAGGLNARTIACLAPNRRVEIVAEVAPATERG